MRSEECPGADDDTDAMEQTMTPQGWKLRPLSDVAEATVGHVGPMAHEYVPDGIPFLRSQDVSPLRVRTGALKYVSESFHRRLAKSALTPGDVVIVRTGQPGAAAVIPPELPIANCADLVIVRPGPELDARFLAYYVNSAAQGHIAAHLVGAVQQHFNVTSAKALRIALPPLDEQVRIVSVLGPFDDKMDSNRRLANVLESMVATMFRRRFVDLRHGATSEGQPADRQMGTLSALADIVKDSVQPSGTPEATFEHFSIPAFDADGDPEEALGATILSGKIRIPDRDVILLSKLNPRMKRVWWPRPSGVGTPVCSPEFLVLEPRAGIPASYLYAMVGFDERFYGELLGHVTGTTGSRQRVKPRDAMACAVFVPSTDELQAWDAFARPLLDFAHRTRAENRILARVRDALLPRLVSGAIRVPETRDVEDAMGIATEEVAA